MKRSLCNRARWRSAMVALCGATFIVSALSAHAVTVDNRKWKLPVQIDVRDAPHASVDNFTPQVAVDHSGNATVVWELSDGTIWSRRFRASDKQWEAPLKVTDVGSSPQVAMDGSGNAFAVWEQSGGVRASRYSNGSWGEIKALQAVSGTGSTPHIVADANGNALAVWSQSGGHVWANRYTKNSASWGTAEQLESNAGTASSPQIAIDANGNALTVWTQAQTIWANYFTISGTPHWVGAKVAETNTASASAPQVTFDGLGNGRAIWTETDSGTDHVWSSRYTASSNQWDQVRAIESNAGSAVAPQVAADATGNAVAVWFQFNSSCNCNNVFSSRYVTSASQWEGALLLESDNTHDAVSPSIAIDANGNALAVWQQRQLDASLYGIFAARYTPSATLQASWTPAELIDHDDTGDASLPRVVFDANGNAMAAWYQFDGRSEVQHFSIRANRYAGPDAFGRFAYIPTRSLLQTYVVDGATGQMRLAGSFDRGAGTVFKSMAIEPRGQFAYVLEANSAISHYRVDAVSGALTLLNLVGTPVSPLDIVVEPLGRFIYVSTAAGIATYVIDQSTGRPIQNSNISASVSGQFDVDPSGRFLYLPVANAIAIYAINATTGALTDTGLRRAGGANSSSIRISPSGRFAYTASIGANSVAAYSINSATGDLSAVGSPIVGAQGPYRIAIDSTERFLYVMNRASGSVSAYAIAQSNGALSALAGGPIASGTTPNDIRIDPSGLFLYVANLGSKDVVSLAIDPRSGALTRAAVPVLQVGNSDNDNPFVGLLPGATPQTVSSKIAVVSAGPGALAIDPSTGGLTPVPGAGSGGYAAAAIDPTGLFAFFSRLTFGISVVDSYRIDATTGAPTLVTSGPFNSSTELSLAVSANGQFLYSADTADVICCAPQFGKVHAYQIDRTSGALSALTNGVFFADKTTSAVATHPTLPLVFAANRNSADVSVFQIGADGRLTSLGTVPTGSQPLTLVVDPSGRFLYVGNFGAGSISGYSISGSGSLTPLPGSPFVIGVNPNHIAVDPLGRFVYTIWGGFGPSLGVFRINAQTGVLTPVAGGSPAGVFPLSFGPHSIAANVNGRFVYIGSGVANAVSVFSIDPSTGVPTEIAGSPFPAGGFGSVEAIVLK